MEEFDDTFFERIDEDDFDRFLSDVTIEMKKHNQEYKNLLEQKYEILKKSPALEDLLDNGKEVKLTPEEILLFYDYELIMIDLSVLESKEMFIKGMKEAYYLFKRLDIIK